jgi:hypothetical protein
MWMSDTHSLCSRSRAHMSQLTSRAPRLRKYHYLLATRTLILSNWNQHTCFRKTNCLQDRRQCWCHHTPWPHWGTDYTTRGYLNCLHLT